MQENAPIITRNRGTRVQRGKNQSIINKINTFSDFRYYETRETKYKQ